jgi:hypothetical protein
MNIQQIPYGLNKNVINVLLEWEIKPFFSEVYNLKILLMDEGNNLVDVLDKQMTPDKNKFIIV